MLQHTTATRRRSTSATRRSCWQRPKPPTEHNHEVIYPIRTRLNLEYIDEWSLARDFGYSLVTMLPVSDHWLKLVPTDDVEPPPGPEPTR